MPVQTIPLSVVGGFDSARARSETRGDYPNSRNHVLAPGGRGIKPRPGYVKAGAFCLYDGYRQNEHRIVISDGGDYAREPASMVFNIVDGWTGDVKAMQKFSGGVPFPSDSDNNPNPPHEFMTDKRLVNNAASAWTAVPATVTMGTATTAPVLRKTTDSADSHVYGTMSMTSSVVAGSLAYFNVSGIVPGGHNAVQVWLYFDGDERQIPAGHLTLRFASSTALGGTTKDLIIPINLPPNRWICATLDWDNDGATFGFASIGFVLNSAFSSTLFQSGAIALRFESIYSGRVFNLNRVSNNDTFHMNELPGPVKGIIFGNEFNADLMYDGKDLMPAGIPAPHFKPGLSLAQDPDASATVLADGTDVLVWREPVGGATGPFFAVTDTTPTARTTVEDGTNAWTVPAAQAAFVAVTNTNTNPTSPSGGNYVELTFTNQPTTFGTIAYRNVAGTLNDTLFFRLYLDFFASGTGAPTEVIYRGDTMTMKFWSGAGATGSTVAEVTLAQTYTYPVPVGGGQIMQVPYTTISRQLQTSKLRIWTLVNNNNLTGGAFSSVSIEFKHALESTAIYDGSNNWKVRFDDIHHMPSASAIPPDGRHLDFTFSRNAGTAGTELSEAPITSSTEKAFVYKNTADLAGAPASVSLGLNNAIQFWMRLETYNVASGGTAGYLASGVLKMVFYSAITLGGNELQPADTFGLVNFGPSGSGGLIGNTWTKVTIKMLPAGFSFSSFGFKLVKKINDEAYYYAGNNNQCRIKIDDIRIVASTTAPTDIATDGLRVGFTWYDEKNQRESALSPFSNPLNLPANGTAKMDISGFRGGLPLNSQNYCPDPYTIQKIGVYVHFPLWGLTADGIPRFNRLGYFPIPDGAPGEQNITFANTEDLTKVGDTGALASFTNHYPPACKTALAHKSRIARAGQARYSVGQVACTAGSPAISVVDAGGTATPRFGDWTRYLKMRLLVSGADTLQFTIFHIYADAGALKVLASTTFDQVNNEWRLDTVPVTSTAADYIIEGEDNALFWTSEDQGRIKPWAAAITNRDDLPGSDRIEGLHLVGEVLLVCGRDSLYAYRQSTTLDDIPSTGPAYSNPTQLSAKPGILAHRSFARDAGGTSHWLGRGGVIFGGSLAGGFIADPLSNPLRKLFAEGTTIHKESLMHAHGAYDDRRKRYYLFTPGVDE